MEQNASLETGTRINVIVDETVREAVVMSTDRTHIKVYMNGSVVLVSPTNVLALVRCV